MLLLTILLQTSAAISLLSLNLFIRQPLIVSKLTGDGKDERIQYFCENIVGHYDVIALQEVFTDARKAQILECAKSRGLLHHQSGPQPTYSEYQITDSGLLLLSRHPFTNNGSTHTFSDGTGIDSVAAKGVIHAHVADWGSIWVTHTQATYDNIDAVSDARRKQILELRAYIDRTGGRQGGVLMGDLNVIGGSDEYDNMMAIFDNGRDLLYESMGRHPITFGADKVMTGNPDDYGKKERLDYLIAFGSLRSRGCKVVEFEIDAESGLHVSDHFGVSCEVYPDSELVMPKQVFGPVVQALA